METVRDLILLSGKRWRVFASGETPSAAEFADGLVAVQSLVDEIYVGWTDVEAASPYEAKEDERIKTTSTVTLPDLVVGDCGQRRPRSGAKVMVIDDEGTTLSIYRGDNADWITASALTLDSAIPFDAQQHNTLTDAVAGRWMDMFGEPTGAQYRMGLRALGILSLATRPQTDSPFF